MRSLSAIHRSRPLEVPPSPASSSRVRRTSFAPAGFLTSRIEVEHSIDRSLDRALAEANGSLFALPTYTALLELRNLLSRRGLAPTFWT